MNQALGYALLEMILSSFSPPTSRREMQTLKLKRQVEDLFDWDVSGRFREYVMAEAEYEPAVALLDQKDKAGWDFIERLIRSRLGWREPEHRFKPCTHISNPSPTFLLRHM